MSKITENVVTSSRKIKLLENKLHQLRSQRAKLGNQIGKINKKLTELQDKVE